MKLEILGYNICDSKRLYSCVLCQRRNGLKNEAIRHHYIPQFILKNFCFNDKGKVYYYEKMKNGFSIKDTCNVFMEKNLYRDEINTDGNPTKVETDLSLLEREASRIIKDKLLGENEFVIRREENEVLKLFFAVMGFRSPRVRKSFVRQSQKHSESIFSDYQIDGNLEDFWKRNLGYLVNCRTLKDVIDHPHIDDPIKMFFIRDTCGFMGLYFAVAEKRGMEAFVIGDAYPVQLNGTFLNGSPLHIYSVFPISPDRVVFLVEHMAENFILKEHHGIRPCVVKSPKFNFDKSCAIRVKKMYDDEVKYINNMIIKESTIGYISKTETKIDL